MGRSILLRKGQRKILDQWPRCLPASFSDVGTTGVAMANATLSKNRRTDGLRASFGSDTQSGTQMISSGVVAKFQEFCNNARVDILEPSAAPGGMGIARTIGHRPPL